jgi:hypothetical protein
MRFSLNQAATYWAKTGIDGYGKPSFSAPASWSVRWQDVTVLVRGGGIQELNSSTVVFTKDAPRTGDYFYLGSSSISDPLAVDGAREVGFVARSPSLSAGVILYKSVLK